MRITPNVGFELVLDTLGVVQTMRISGPRADELHYRLAPAWSWCTATANGDAEHCFDVVLDDDEATIAAAQEQGFVADTDPFRLAHRLTPMLTLEAIGRLAGQLLMLHAAVVCDPRSGDAVVLVGPSGSGKTTLAAQLGQEFGYITDETAAIEEDLTIRPFPKPLSLLGASRPEKDQVGPEQLGLVRPQATPRAVAVMLLDRSVDGPESPTLGHMPKLAAIAALAEQSSHLKRLDRPLHRLGDLLDATGGMRVLSYRNSADVAPIVRAVIGGLA